MSRRLVVLLLGLLAVTLSGVEGIAGVQARIDLRAQRMVVRVDGEIAHVWKVSTARTGYVTPRGAYRPKRLERMWYSSKYDDAPMPYAIFFRGGYAVHGTLDHRNLGRPASHGCVRLAVPHARILFGLVRQAGPGASAIVIH